MAHAVKQALARGVDIAELPLAELPTLHPGIDADVAQVLTLCGSMATRDIVGGKAPAQVRAQAARYR